jgi:hypothetical protein
MCIRRVGTIIKRRGFQTKVNGGNILKGGREKKCEGKMQAKKERRN